jgi:hypothetical protein
MTGAKPLVQNTRREQRRKEAENDHATIVNRVVRGGNLKRSSRQR